ncbi:hypothetical protein BDV95DRAFT_604604 [Massariosphaeria phaeospora]|uniref:Amidohydrolase-related domain-containing protein n=1 Tax=Massariosphaeria phaeospora TaxID=100035 RepID=A0A7C8MG00_9PLEO|nr:hypothetical protein BDV95DRAFT_604604 [Massariosphaeria phaeospora]
MASPLSPTSDGSGDQETGNMLQKALGQNKPRAPPPRCSDVYPSGALDAIMGVRLPDRPSSTLWDVFIADGRIASIESHDPASSGHPTPVSVHDGASRLLAPSLCHAHIHLDKCFLLQDPKFSDLQIESGDFQEAMAMTGKAKARFDEDDLLRRGRQLIDESIRYGVTAMRAFVEVDGGVQFKCLNAGLKLREEFEGRCEVQICAFAQLPLFSGEDGGKEIRKLMTTAAHRDGVDVLGSTPYVEQDEVKSRMNVRWISTLALINQKHLDLHLDYFLDELKQPLVWTTLDIIRDRKWVEKEGKHITLGHCTRLTRFSETQWNQLKQQIGNLPISFVGLPTSDLFMMQSQEHVRGTLPVVDMIQQHGLSVAVAVNNIGNAFTPYGTCDPLSIASLGEAVSSRAKTAIGCSSTTLSLEVGQPADFVLFDRADAGWRCRKSIAEVVYDAGPSRQTRAFYLRGGDTNFHSTCARAKFTGERAKPSINSLLHPPHPDNSTTYLPSSSLRALVDAMDVAEATEAYYSPTQFASGDVKSYMSDSQGGPEPAYDIAQRGSQDAIFAHSLRFLENVKHRFGEQSHESASIYNALSFFRAGMISKNQAYHTIMNLLVGEYQDLGLELQGLLSHRDARWGVGDFDIHHAAQSSPAVTHVAPQLLQPDHQPQLQPLIPTLWDPTQYAQRQQQSVQTSINPQLLRVATDHHVTTQDQEGYDATYHGYDSCRPESSYHPSYVQNAYTNISSGHFAQAVPSSPHARTPHQRDSPVEGHRQTPSFPPYLGYGNGLQLSSPAQNFAQHSYPLGDTWGRAHGGVAWPRGETDQVYSSPVLSNRNLTSHSSSPHHGPYASPSVLGTPIAVPLGQPAFEMLPPRKRTQRSSLSYTRVTEDGTGEESKDLLQRSSSPPSEELVLVRPLSENQGKPKQTRSARSRGQFIHSICGKTFTTRWAVKKHHWGTNGEDIATKTGCWARNGKPNFNWDDDPSCQEEKPRARVAKTAGPLGDSGIIPVASTEYKAPEAPAMFPNRRNTLPGFPTLDELPRTVAEAINTSTPARVSPREDGPYYGARLPVRSSMDSLLTAVNAASRIEAPKPQGRHDSLVSVPHLDAQAAAGSYYRQIAPKCEASYGQSEEEQEYSHRDASAQSWAPVLGLGITQAEGVDPVPANMVLSSHAKVQEGAILESVERAEDDLDTDRNQVQLEDDPALISTKTAEENHDNTRSRRRGRGVVSKRELKELAWGGSPGPEKKKQKL